MLDRGSIVFINIQRNRIRTGTVIEDQCIAFDLGTGPVCLWCKPDPVAEIRHAPIAGDGLGNDRTAGMRRKMNHLRTGILKLISGTHRNRDAHAMCIFASQNTGGILHGDAGSDISVYPFHDTVFFHLCTLCDQVQNIAAPVLNTGITAFCIPADKDFYNRRMHGILGILRSGASLYIGTFRTIIHDDDRAFKLTHGLGIDAEIGLQRFFQLDAGRHINKAASGPDCRIQRGQFVIRSRYDRRKILSEDLRVFPQAAVNIKKDHTFGLYLFQHVVIDRFRFILGRYAGQILLFRFRDTELLKGILDLFRHIIPALFRFLGNPLVIGEVLKIDLGEIRSPFRHRHRFKLVKGLHAEFGHPFRFPFDLTDGAYNLFIQSFSGIEDTDVLIRKSIAVIIL